MRLQDQNEDPIDIELEDKIHRLGPQKYARFGACSSAYRDARIFDSAGYPHAPGSFRIELWKPNLAMISVPVRHQIEDTRSRFHQVLPEFNERECEWHARVFIFPDACKMVYVATIVDCDYWLDPVAAGPMVHLEMYLVDTFPARFDEFNSWEMFED